jgi:hypothetical protein
VHAEDAPALTGNAITSAQGTLGFTKGGSAALTGVEATFSTGTLTPPGFATPPIGTTTTTALTLRAVADQTVTMTVAVLTVRRVADQTVTSTVQALTKRTVTG